MTNIVYLNNFVQLRITNYITAHISDGLVSPGEGGGNSLSGEKMEPVPRTRCWEQKFTIEYSFTKRLVSFRMILFKQNFDPLKTDLCQKFYYV